MLNLLPGLPRAPSAKDEADLFDPTSVRVKKVLVYFLGGVTYAEISAIRFINKLPSMQNRFKFVVATTSIISSEKCMHQMRTAAINNLELSSLAAMN